MYVQSALRDFLFVMLYALYQITRIVYLTAYLLRTMQAMNLASCIYKYTAIYVTCTQGMPAVFMFMYSDWLML